MGKGKTTKNTGGGHLGQNLAAAAASTGTSITGHLQTSIRKAGTLKKYASSEKIWFAQLARSGIVGDSWKTCTQELLVVVARRWMDNTIKACRAGGKVPIEIMSATVNRLHEKHSLELTNPFAHKSVRTSIKSLKATVKKMCTVKHAPRLTSVSYEKMILDCLHVRPLCVSFSVLSQVHLVLQDKGMLDAREKGGRSQSSLAAILVIVGTRYFGCRTRTLLSLQLKHLFVHPNDLGPMGVSMYAKMGGTGGAGLKTQYKSGTGLDTLEYVMVENQNNLVLCFRFWLSTVLLSEVDERLVQAKVALDPSAALADQYLIARRTNHSTVAFNLPAFSDSVTTEKDDSMMRRWFKKFFSLHVGYHTGRQSFVARAALKNICEMSVRLMMALQESGDQVFNAYKHPEAEVRLCV